jgi:agmatinase
MTALLGIPYDAASSFLRGAAEGPAAIRAALRSPSTNAWSESIHDVVSQLHDAGDVDLDTGDVRAAIDERAHHLFASGNRVIALGGDHSITYPLVRALSRSLGSAHFSILHLDAHPDLYPEYDGDPYSHACPFARIMEEQLKHRLVQVGIRCMNDVQHQQAETYGVEVIDMRAWARGVRPVLRGPTYLSLDLDVFDPGFAPGVSHREPGGLSPREVITLIQELEGDLIGADIVELNPSRDLSGITAPLAAKLLKEIAARM